MNRKMRRAAEKRAADREVARVHGVLEKNEKRLIDTAERQVFVNWFPFWALALHDLYGFGETRIFRVYQKIYDMGVAMQEGYITPEDVRKQVRDEIGLEFQVDGSVSRGK